MKFSFHFTKHNAQGTHSVDFFYFSDRKDLEYLIENKADVNAKTDNGQTALHYAVVNGNYKEFKFGF